MSENRITITIRGKLAALSFLSSQKNIYPKKYLEISLISCPEICKLHENTREKTFFKKVNITTAISVFQSKSLFLADNLRR